MLTPSKSFTNMVTGASQRDEPPVFRGGIIADPMGLGKTLTMISLIAADIDAVNSATSGSQHPTSHHDQPGASLIIVPPPRESDQFLEEERGDKVFVT